MVDQTLPEAQRTLTVRDSSYLIGCTFGHQDLHQFQLWPPGGNRLYRFHQTAPLALVIVILPGIVLLASSVNIELVSASARVTTDCVTPGPIDRTPCTHGSDKKHFIMKQSVVENITFLPHFITFP